MKQLTCEMCGSNDMLKQDGVFVCQSCGIKYSVEEAKKMMIEGDVTVNAENVSLISKSDNYEEILTHSKLLLKDNHKEGLIRCNQAIAINPNRYEAWALKAKYLINSFCEDDVIIEVLNKLKEVTPDTKIHDVYDDIIDWFILHTTKYSITPSTSYPRLATLYLNIDSLSPKKDFEAAESIINLFHNGRIPSALRNEAIIELEKKVFKRRSDAWELLDEAEKSIIKKPLSFEEYLENSFDNLSKTLLQKNKTGGCYVATCVYGSYDCPEVWTLRRFRDNTLGETWYGRTFIRIYYSVSPTLVKWFGNTKWFKKMWKGTLDRIVKKLEANGVESTPYQDKNW